MDGFLVIDKPGGMTSRDAVNVVQRWFPRRTKIGHTGTLDPLATGVLVLCIGTATKLADRVQSLEKSYHTRILLGSVSTTDDADGVITEISCPAKPTLDAIRIGIASFVGKVEQLPPAFSAVKVQGQRAYALARSGQTVTLRPRIVRIDRIEIARYEWPHLDLIVECGKGTYIRSIARDLGLALGIGGLVHTLRRTRVGPFRVEDGLPLTATDAAKRLIPVTILDTLSSPNEDRKFLGTT